MCSEEAQEQHKLTIAKPKNVADTMEGRWKKGHSWSLKQIMCYDRALRKHMQGITGAMDTILMPAKANARNSIQVGSILESLLASATALLATVAVVAVVIAVFVFLLPNLDDDVNTFIFVSFVP